MSISRKILIGVLVSTLFVFISVIIIGYFLVSKSFPQTNGTIEITGLANDVKIFRDDYGVPHIYAGSEYDAFYSVGFIHAQDRLWQMELIRRVGAGRLSEVLGEPALKVDKMFRMLGLSRQVEKLALSLDQETQFALQAYADGINQFILMHKGKYPIEFDMLKIEPEPWTIENSLLVSRLMAWELNYSRWVDLLLAELVQCFGEVKAKEIFPYWPENAPLIIPKDLKNKNVTESLLPLFEAEKAYRSLLGLRAIESGSNAWAVSGAKSATGKPILANDPHLLLMVPARWYELHIIAPSIDVAGMSLPGVPFVVVGRNQKIAWGVTNAMLDDNDYYIEQVDSIQHPTHYRFNNQWLPVVEVVDTIIVKGSLPVLLSTYSTHRGPIINKMEPGAQFMKALISMRWVGHEISNEAGAFYKINKSNNWKEFTEALKLFWTPAQNFVYADVDGNIGYRTGGRIPIRKTKGATLPFPGWTDEYDWKGYVPFEQMPQIFNPPEGFIVTANNKIVDDSYPFHISNHWESPWRSMRINEVLREQSKFTLEDIQKLQFDLVSIHAREVVPLILHAYDTVQVSNKNVKTMLEYLRNWTYEMRPEDVSTTLFQSTLTKMIFNTFRNKMDERLYRLYDTLSSTPLSALSNLLKNPSSDWFDDPSTEKVETRDDIIRKSVEDAVDYLQTELGGELKEWRWGRLHTVTFGHLFGANKLLAKIFNIGPYAVGGAHSTVNVGQYFIASSFENVVGPSMRQIFNLADINDSRTVLPPGQSGQVFTKHYKDQIMLWLNGGYKMRYMDRQIIETDYKEVLTLKSIK